MFDQIKSAVEFASHLPRYHEILRILFRYGFGDLLRLVALQRLMRIEPVSTTVENESGILAKPLPVRLRLALEDLGPTFVKFGQIVSSRRDLVTEEFYFELCKLQENVPPFPSDQAKAIIEEELGRPIREVFANFDDEPVGGASIAQVHAAVLRNGEQVAVKVRRPDIQRLVELDLAVLHDLARFVERHVPELEVLGPVSVVEEFSIILRRELDFTNEARNCERFAKQFAEEPLIFAPKIYRELSTERVLTMEYFRGTHVTDISALKKKQIDPCTLAETISDLIYAQMFTYGFFHADPHPGNITVLKDGVVGLYDYGMMGMFTEDSRASIARMIAGLAKKDHQLVMRSILELSERGYAIDTARMLRDVEDFNEQHLNQPLKDIRLDFVLNKLLELLRNNRLRMRSSFYLGVKALSQVEAIGRALHPDLNFVIRGEPYARALIAGRYHPFRLASLLSRLSTETIDLLEDLPQDVRAIYARIKHGHFSIPLEHKINPDGFEPMRKTLDLIANRLTNAILAASVLICSAILVMAGLPPKLFNVPVIGFVGLCFGTFMSVRLIVSVWRHGGL